MIGIFFYQILLLEDLLFPARCQPTLWSSKHNSLNDRPWCLLEQAQMVGFLHHQQQFKSSAPSTLELPIKSPSTDALWRWFKNSKFSHEVSISIFLKKNRIYLCGESTIQTFIIHSLIHSINIYLEDLIIYSRHYSRNWRGANTGHAL